MKLNKIFKLGMLLLIIVSVAILIWGFATGWPKLGQEANAPINTLLGWTYVMIGIAVFCWVVVGLIKTAIDNPKGLVKIGFILVGAAAVVLVAYLCAKGTPAVGYTGNTTPAELKLTDTILNLAYICGAGAIVAIIVGEIRMSIASKK